MCTYAHTKIHIYMYTHTHICVCMCVCTIENRKNIYFKEKRKYIPIKSLLYLMPRAILSIKGKLEIVHITISRSMDKLLYIHTMK